MREAFNKSLSQSNYLAQTYLMDKSCNFTSTSFFEVILVTSSGFNWIPTLFFSSSCSICFNFFFKFLTFFFFAVSGSSVATSASSPLSLLVVLCFLYTGPFCFSLAGLVFSISVTGLGSSAMVA